MDPIIDAGTEAVSDLHFLASMSHEIRTPMNSMLAMLELLAKTPLTDEQNNILRITRDSAQTLTRIADDILDFSKIRMDRVALEFVAVDLRQMIVDLVALLRAENRTRPICIDANIDNRLADRLVTDPTRLRQILLNVACNAMKFTHKGRVTIKLAVRTSHDDDVQRVAVSIIDTGIGMSRDALQRVWEPFAQARACTSRVYGGTGLGLTIARGLAKRLGGELTIRSRPGKGTTACLTIALRRAPAQLDRAEGPDGCAVYAPAASQQSLQPHAPGEAHGPLPPHGARRTRLIDQAHQTHQTHQARQTHQTHQTHQSRQSSPRPQTDTRHRPDTTDVPPWPSSISGPTLPCTIALEHTSLPARAAFRLLIVDDHPTNRMVLSMQLTQLGYAFDAVEDGEQALDRLRMRRYDLMLTDCRMPGVDGYSLASAWRRIETAGALPMPVIGLTANPLESEVPIRRASGMDDCLVKPITLEKLASTLDRMLLASATQPASLLVGWALDEARRNADLAAPFDLLRLKRHFGSADSVKQVLKSFIVTTQEDLALLQPYLADADPLEPACRTRLHRITGGLQVLGDHRLAEEGAALESVLALQATKRGSREVRNVIRESIRLFSVKVMLRLDWLIRCQTAAHPSIR